MAFEWYGLAIKIMIDMKMAFGWFEIVVKQDVLIELFEYNSLRPSPNVYNIFSDHQTLFFLLKIFNEFIS